MILGKTDWLSHRKIKFFADRTFLPDGKYHTILLYPFWGNREAESGDFFKDRFKEYVACGNLLFEIVKEPEAADLFVLPFEYASDPLSLTYTNRLVSLARRHNKKVLIFFNSDSSESISLDNCIVFRTSFYRSKRQECEFAFPAWMEDFYQQDESGYIEKRRIPSVSYCGYIDYVDGNLSLREKLFWMRKRFFHSVSNIHPDELGPAIRGKAVRCLRKNRKIDLHFIRRDGFWAPGIDRNTARKEYIENMLGADYALVTRGAGNFSYRLYEALSCSRIPLFIDTDCVLPFDHIIDWKKYMVWVDEKDISRVDEILLEYHAGLTADKFNELRTSIRKLYEEWITPLAFFSHIQECIAHCNKP